VVDDIEVPAQHGPHGPERARFYVEAHRMDTGTSTTVVVVERENGWSIHGLDPEQRGVVVSRGSMSLLGRSIVARIPTP
jgi:hypothetical protein